MHLKKIFSFIYIILKYTDFLITWNTPYSITLIRKLLIVKGNWNAKLTAALNDTQMDFCQKYHFAPSCRIFKNGFVRYFSNFALKSITLRCIEYIIFFKIIYFNFLQCFNWFLIKFLLYFIEYLWHKIILNIC